MKEESKLGRVTGWSHATGFIFTKEVAPDSEKGKKLLADVNALKATQEINSMSKKELAAALKEQEKAEKKTKPKAKAKAKQKARPF